MADASLARSVAQQVEGWLKDITPTVDPYCDAPMFEQADIRNILTRLAEREQQLVALVKETYDDHGDPWNRAGDTFSGRCKWCKRAEVFLIDPPVTP